MKFVKLHEDAIKPERKTQKAAAYDFHAYETITISANGVAVIPTGITFEDMPEDQFLDIRLRSGTSISRPLLLANGAGVVDSDYEGQEIGIIVYNRHQVVPVTIEKGDRIAQGVLLKYHTEDSEKKPTRKRTGGMGSTGDK